MCENERTAAVKSEFSADMSMDDGNRMNTQYNTNFTHTVICEKHNHEPARDMEGHPHAMRLSNKEYRLVVKLFMNGLKPRAILSILKERHPDNLSTITTIYNVLQKFPKPGNAETLMADMVNDQETVSLSPESNPYAFDAKRMKRNVDHTAPFATGNWVQGFNPAEDEPTLGRPFQLYRDVAFYKPKGQFSNDSLSMDVEKRMNAQYNTNFTHSMCENERTAAVKSKFSADMSMHAGNRMNTQYNTNFTHTMSEIEANCAVNGTSEFSTNMVFKS
nr:protein FAR1-related sequence 5-like [Tanacetum cinerariifolium]